MSWIWPSNGLISLGYLAIFPTQRNREFFQPNRELSRDNRETHLRIRERFNRLAAGSNPARFLFYIKDLLAVQAVSSEPVSAEFPVIQGKNREFLQIQPDPALKCPITC